MKKKIPVDIFHKRGCSVQNQQSRRCHFCVNEILRNGYGESMLVTAYINTVSLKFIHFLLMKTLHNKPEDGYSFPGFCAERKQKQN